MVLNPAMRRLAGQQRLAQAQVEAARVAPSTGWPALIQAVITSYSIHYTKLYDATVYNVKQGIRAWIKAGQPVDGATRAASTCTWAASC